MEGFEETALLFHKVDNAFLADTHAVHPYALAKVYKVRTRVESHLAARALEDGRKRVRA